MGKGEFILGRRGDGGREKGRQRQREGVREGESEAEREGEKARDSDGWHSSNSYSYVASYIGYSLGRCLHFIANKEEKHFFSSIKIRKIREQNKKHVTACLGVYKEREEE
ncbi:unnamed protein product [Gadus morhua 'NCC']